MDVGKMQRAITAKTRAVIPVHLYGHPASMDLVLHVADQHGIYVLEDCAQAHGASYMGKRVGGWGHLAGFSFYPTKNLGAIGDGGIITTNDPALAEKIRLLREYGWKSRYVSEVPGFNSRLDELQAAVLRVKLRYLDKHNEARRNFARVYTTALSDLVDTPIEQNDAHHVYHLYVIRSTWRDQLRAFLEESGIGTGIQYPVPIHLQPAYAGLGTGKLLTVTEHMSKEILSLPLYPQMTMEQVEYVAGKIGEFFRKTVA
jgi:dTDP-4-amino-4,6-dideoxygalactose transaminase